MRMGGKDKAMKGKGRGKGARREERKEGVERKGEGREDRETERTVF